MKQSSKSGKFFIISAPTGAGKTTVTTEALKQLNAKGIMISRVVTHTTRNPRPNEINGVDYIFETRSDFANKLQSGFFLETTEYAGEFYGSPASVISDMQNGKSFTVIVDRPGVESYLRLIPGSITIWITVSDVNSINERLAHRPNRSPEEIEKRFEIAKQEIASESKNSIFRYHVLNDKFDQAVKRVMEIITNELDTKN